jgi:hypothetical protein
MQIDVIGRTQGPFFGRTFSDLELDLKSLTLIPEELRTGEAQLFTTKHAKYRALHPMAATMEFAAGYIEAYRFVMRRREDFRIVKTLKVFSAPNPMDDTEQNRVGLWKARRAADTVGADYQAFCVEALDYSERAGWKRLAMPRELANINVIEAVLAKLTGR